MSKRDKIYQEYSENGYPEDPKDKSEFATKFLGARLVGAMESVLEDKLKVLNGNDSENDPKFEALKSLNEEQRIAVEELLKDNSKSFFYWLLVKMRNFPDYLELNIMELDEETDTLNKVCDVGECNELHHLYFSWIEEFSDYIEEA